MRQMSQKSLPVRFWASKSAFAGGDKILAKKNKYLGNICTVLFRILGIQRLNKANKVHRLNIRIGFIVIDR